MPWHLIQASCFALYVPTRTAEAVAQVRDPPVGGGALGERALPGVGVVRAAKGIAQTGTCIVVTDDEALRHETMLPEVSVILLNSADILPDLPSAAPFLRAEQTQGRASYVSFITGPSRTADIERVSAIGVHGPLELHIVLIGGRP